MATQSHRDGMGDAIASPPTGAPSATVKVWDLAVRVFHWSLVFSFAAAFILAEEWRLGHEWLGYAAAGLVGFRLIWGLVGTRHARFVNFLRGPRATLDYLSAMLKGKERRYLGHNPAGAAMILALLAGVLGLGATGYMMTLDAYWGVAWVEEVHGAIANGMLLLIALHVGGVVLASMRHGENLARAMVTGCKRTDP